MCSVPVSKIELALSLLMCWEKKTKSNISKELNAKKNSGGTFKPKGGLHVQIYIMDEDVSNKHQ